MKLDFIEEKSRIKKFIYSRITQIVLVFAPPVPFHQILLILLYVHPVKEIEYYRMVYVCVLSDTMRIL